MTYDLIVSSQGQVVIPVGIRAHLGIVPGSKIRIRSAKQGKIPIATIEPPTSWVDRVAGIAKGVYGKGEEYIEKERQTWDR